MLVLLIVCMKINIRFILVCECAMTFFVTGHLTPPKVIQQKKEKYYFDNTMAVDMEWLVSEVTNRVTMIMNQEISRCFAGVLQQKINSEELILAEIVRTVTEVQVGIAKKVTELQVQTENISKIYFGITELSEKTAASAEQIAVISKTVKELQAYSPASSDFSGSRRSSLLSDDDVLCSGVNKNGSICQHKAKVGYCGRHGSTSSNENACKGRTKQGKRCKRNASRGQEYCTSHTVQDGTATPRKNQSKMRLKSPNSSTNTHQNQSTSRANHPITPRVHRRSHSTEGTEKSPNRSNRINSPSSTSTEGIPRRIPRAIFGITGRPILGTDVPTIENYDVCPTPKIMGSVSNGLQRLVGKSNRVSNGMDVVKPKLPESSMPPMSPSILSRNELVKSRFVSSKDMHDFDRIAMHEAGDRTIIVRSWSFGDMKVVNFSDIDNLDEADLDNEYHVFVDGNLVKKHAKLRDYVKDIELIGNVFR